MLGDNVDYWRCWLIEEQGSQTDNNQIECKHQQHAVRSGDMRNYNDAKAADIPPPDDSTTQTIAINIENNAIKFPQRTYTSETD